ncbi:hypothetical protein ACVMAJ_000089 [Bradyrhizobium sp. USDA 4448]
MHAVERPIEVDGHALQIDLCVGAALYPRDADNAVSLLANADAAFYRAKHEGRAAIRLFTSAMDQQLRERRRSSTTCGSPSSDASSFWSISRSSTGTARRRLMRRSSVGAIRFAASFRPASSFRSPNGAARSRR